VKKTDAFQSSPLRKKKKRKRKRERERERDAKSSALHWLEKDRSLSSLSLLLIFAPSFLPCFLPSCLLSLALLWGRERERVLLFGSFRFENNERTVTMMRSSSVVFLIFKGLLFSRKRWFWDVYQRRREKARERGRGRFGRNLSPERERKIVSFFERPPSLGF